MMEIALSLCTGHYGKHMLMLVEDGMMQHALTLVFTMSVSYKCRKVTISDFVKATLESNMIVLT